jgi:fatty-acyl-CoA synthase
MESELPAMPADSHEVANIQYTSGTTGSPKGVQLSHRNVLNNAYLISRCLHATEADRLVMPVPMYHCFGCVMASLLCVVTGAALIMPSPQFDPLATLAAVEEERGTMLYGVPTMFIAQLDHPEFKRFDLTSLRTGIMAGSSCPIEVMRRVVTVMHCRELTIAYGQTESSPVITMSRVDDSLELRVATVGSVMPATEVKIVSTDNGETVPAGVQGELCTRGYLVMSGYDGDPEGTGKVIDGDGWLHTGDLAVMREDGYFRITGRSRDVIIRGGENIYPLEIEEFLHTHPKVSNVQVVGLPDIKLGETVLAWIRLKPGETATAEEIRAYCQGKIAYFKVPQRVSFVDAFPMTVSGKVQKFVIRQMEIERLGLKEAANVETA